MRGFCALSKRYALCCRIIKTELSAYQIAGNLREKADVACQASQQESGRGADWSNGQDGLTRLPNQSVSWCNSEELTPQEIEAQDAWFSWRPEDEVLKGSDSLPASSGLSSLRTESKAAKLLREMTAGLSTGARMEVNLSYKLAELSSEEDAEAWLEFCRAAGQSKTLRKLELQGNDLGRDLRAPERTVSWKMLMLCDSLAKNTSLEVLNLAANDIDDESARLLAEALRTMKSLKALYLYSNEIGCRGVAELAKALSRGQRLLVLDLTTNFIGNAGAEALASCLRTSKDPKIKWLHLRDNRIGKEGTSALTWHLPARDAKYQLPQGSVSESTLQGVPPVAGSEPLKKKTQRNRVKKPTLPGQGWPQRGDFLGGTYIPPEKMKKPSVRQAEESMDASESKEHDKDEVSPSFGGVFLQGNDISWQEGIVHWGIGSQAGAHLNRHEKAEPVTHKHYLTYIEARKRLGMTELRAVSSANGAATPSTDDRPSSGQSASTSSSDSKAPAKATNSPQDSESRPDHIRKPTKLTERPPRRKKPTSLKAAMAEKVEEGSGRAVKQELKSLLPEPWKRVLEGTEAVQALEKVEQVLLKEARNGHPVFPRRDVIFRALELCPPEKVKVVVLGQDPYYNPGQADGLAFSLSSKRMDPYGRPQSLENILVELRANLEARGVTFEYPLTGDLRPWADQGVLLLNAALSVRGGTPNSHSEVWKPFTKAVITALAHQPQPIAFVLWGKYAIALAGHVAQYPEKAIFAAAHPSPLAANRGFFGCGHFNDVNDFLQANGSLPLDWSLVKR